MNSKNSEVISSEVPKNIPEPETIEQTNQKFLNDWVNYFKNLSPRIKIIFPKDKEFDFEKIKIKTALLKELEEGEQEKIIWPKNEIAFLLAIDSNILEEKPSFLVKDVHLFYFGNLAFSLDHFDADCEVIGSEGDFLGIEYNYSGTYSISNYGATALSWNYISELIRRYIKELENKVPPPPKIFD